MDKTGSSYEKLKSAGYEPEQDFAERKTVSVKERRAKYTLNTSGKQKSVVFAIDGDIIKEGKKCDKLILVKKEEKNWSEIFIELKGCRVSDAIDQLKASLENVLFKHSSNKDIRARIVGRSFPSNRSNTDFEKAKIEFRQKFNCDLRGIKSGREESL